MPALSPSLEAMISTPFMRAGHGVVLRGLDDDAHHLVGQRLDDAAAHHDHFGAEDVDEVGDADADVFGGASR